MKLYIAVLDSFPDYMTPTLVAHSVLGAHLHYSRAYIAAKSPVPELENYCEWLKSSFKKVVIRVNKKEFDKIANLPQPTPVFLGKENNTLGGINSCAIPLPTLEVPNVLKFAKMWKPLHV